MLDIPQEITIPEVGLRSTMLRSSNLLQLVGQLTLSYKHWGPLKEYCMHIFYFITTILYSAQIIILQININKYL